VWEQLHVRYYTGYDHLSGNVPITLYATLGDVAYTLGVAYIFALIKSDVSWIVNAQMTDYLALIFVGAFVALFVEYKALALKRWAYKKSMPIIPTLHVGLSPVIQMSLLLPVSVLLAQFIRLFSGV